MNQVNWGIIGLGVIASQFAKGFEGLDSAKLLAIASTNQDKLSKFKKNLKIDIEYSFSNYQTLIEHKEIDIIYIALPTSLHHQWIVKCLDAGKKVLVEKPATMNANEIKEIKKKYSKEKIFIYEAYMYMYHPQILKVIELINQREIGELISMESSIGINILTKKIYLALIR